MDLTKSFTSAFNASEYGFSSLLTIDLNLSKNKNLSSRQVYNVFDIMQDVGGFQGIILILFAQIVSLFFTSITFPHSVLKHLAPVNLNTAAKDQFRVEGRVEKRLNTPSFQVDKFDLVEIFNKLKSYSRLHIPILSLVFFRCCSRSSWLTRKSRHKF